MLTIRDDPLLCQEVRLDPSRNTYLILPPPYLGDTSEISQYIGAVRSDNYYSEFADGLPVCRIDWQEVPQNWQKGPQDWQEGLRNWQKGLRNWQKGPQNWQEVPQNWQKGPQNWQEVPQNWQEVPQNWQKGLRNWQKGPQNWQEGLRELINYPHIEFFSL